MVKDILLYGGAGIIAFWGLSHAAAIRGVQASFGPVSGDGMKIITMEWLAEGLTLCFVGVLVILTRVFGTGAGRLASVVYYACAGMLLVLAALSALTGMRTKIITMRMCPFVKTGVAAMFIFGNLL
jgi:hypothetical protein